MKGIINTNLREDGVLEIYVGSRLFVEVVNGQKDTEFVEDIINSMGYEWLLDGTIRPMKARETTKESIYDEMCRLLTDYEEKMWSVTKEDFYQMLVKIQNNWEAVITVQ